MFDSLDISIRDLTDDLSDDLNVLETKINNLSDKLSRTIPKITEKFSLSEEEVTYYAEKLLPSSESIQDFIIEFITNYFRSSDGKNLLVYLSHKYLFPIFVSAVYRRIIQNPEFKFAPYANVISKLKSARQQDLYKFVAYDWNVRQGKFDMEFDLGVYERYYNIEKYAEAVARTRKILGLKGSHGKSATIAWSRYYDAAHGIRKITKKIKGKKRGEAKIVDVTEEYKNKYWNTIKTRASMLTSLSFFDIIDSGAIPRNLKSDVGGDPYPTYSTPEIFNEVYDETDGLRETLFRESIKPILDFFVEIEFPSISYQTAEDVIERIINGEELPEWEERILISNLISESPARLEEVLENLLEKHGINVKNFTIIHTKKDTLSVRMRNEKGQFVRWKNV